MCLLLSFKISKLTLNRLIIVYNKKTNLYFGSFFLNVLSLFFCYCLCFLFGSGLGAINLSVNFPSELRSAWPLCGLLKKKPAYENVGCFSADFFYIFYIVWLCFARKKFLCSLVHCSSPELSFYCAHAWWSIHSRLEFIEMIE